MNKSVALLPKKTFAKYRKPLIELPNMVENQLLSYKNLVEKDVAEILKEFSDRKSTRLNSSHVD